MTKTLTIADEMRNAKRRDADDLAELLAGELSVTKDACAGIAEAREALDNDALDTLAEALDSLPAIADHAEALRDTIASLNILLIEIGDTEVFSSFVEAYDAAEEALFTYTDLRDSERYPGIGDDRSAAWTEVESCFDLLADAWEQVGE